MSSNILTYENVCLDLKNNPKEFLITGGAGFIGSHICEELLGLGQKVRILDNFSTGSKENIAYLKTISRQNGVDLLVFEGDVRDRADCMRAVQGVDFVSHQAALASVPYSIAEPAITHDVNVTGFINILSAAKEASVKAFVYASSSAIYGDHQRQPKVETDHGNLLSPYAVTKKMNEMYSEIFFRNYEFSSVGLRYFNVFGPRQNPDGPYAAVIPMWLENLKNGVACQIFGDGETSRDFVYVKDAVQANILSLLRQESSASVYNVAAGERTSLTTLARILKKSMESVLGKSCPDAIYKDFREGDIKHSFADVTLIKNALSYSPMMTVKDGLTETVTAFIG